MTEKELATAPCKDCSDPGDFGSGSLEIPNRTPLMHAAWVGHDACLRAVLRSKAQPISYCEEGSHLISILKETPQPINEKDGCSQPITSPEGAPQPISNVNGTSQLISDPEGTLQLISNPEGTSQPMTNQVCFSDLSWQVFEKTIETGQANNPPGFGLLELSNALYCAVLAGNLECVHILLEAGADVNMYGTKYCGDILSANHEACMKLMIERGLTMEPERRVGWTALMQAAQKGHRCCIEMLLEAGANVLTLSDDIRTALYYAAEAHHVECTEVLVRAAGDSSQIGAVWYQAATEGPPELMEAFAKYRADIRKTTTPEAFSTLYHLDQTLILAAGERSPEMCNLFLKKGVDINICGQEKHSLLIHGTYPRGNSYIEESKAVNFTKYLLGLPADINKTDFRGLNALEIQICDVGPTSKEICMLLCAAGEKVNSQAVINSYSMHFRKAPRNPVPEYLQEMQKDLQSDHTLKLKCRKFIREYLLHLNPYINLFARVPKLGLPPVLARYLLCNKSIEE